MGEKGSFKNLYKDLWLRIKYRLKKKKEEEELIRRMEKKYKLSFKDKTKLSFSLILGTIFYSFFSIFSKREEITIKVIESKKDLVEVKKQISEIKKEATRSINSAQIRKCDEKLKSIDNIISNTSYKSKEIEILRKDLVVCKAYVDIKKENIVKEEKRIEKINKNLKEIKEDIQKTNYKVENINLTSEAKEKEIFDIQKEISDIENKIKENKIKEEDIEKIDKFLLLSNSEDLKKLKVKAEYKIKELKNVKNTERKQENKKKKESSIERKLEDKKKEIKKIKSETKQKIDEESKMEFSKFNKIITKEIIISRKQIGGLRRNVKTKKGMLSGLKTFSRNALRFCSSFIPVLVFKSSALATLTSAVLLNNSIRSMRLANGATELSYYDHFSIKKIIKEQNELEKQTSECFNDAFYQINSFKFELENNFAGYKHTNEYKELVLDIQNIESYIVKKQKEHKKEQEKVKILLKNY